ncbi:hypothetical protein [Massilia psychrophila]|uniref:hypothetical protein n=1 Tax=Massilia psychrophila TaxID=1603353 RepID=UPI001C557F3B|nr:hypothetical protein [Massilia psychrophila]
MVIIESCAVMVRSPRLRQANLAILGRGALIWCDTKKTHQSGASLQQRKLSGMMIHPVFGRSCSLAGTNRRFGQKLAAGMVSAMIPMSLRAPKRARTPLFI